jgi:4-amino-4-deoxy-L-arabinose transferase-like glycosyltransferase
MSEKLRRLVESVWFVTLVAFAIRMLVVAFLYQGQMNPRRDHFPFGYEAGRIARAIASGRGFSNPLSIQTGATAWMAPLYPYLVAGVFKIFGIYTAGSALVLLTLNGLFSAFTCLPVFLMARECFGEKKAVWAGWSWALYPYAIYLSAEWIWETCLTTLLLSLVFLFTLRLQHSTRVAPWAGYGLLWGATALSNPAVLSLLPLLAGWACYRLHQRGQRYGLQAAVATLALVIVVTPWFVRNYEVFHRVVPFRDNFWLEVHVGNNGETSHSALEARHPAVSPSEEEEYNRLGELKYMAEKRRESIEFIRTHPGWFARVTIRRFVHTWTGFWSLPANGPLHEPLDPEEPFDPANIALCASLTAMAIVGLCLAFRRDSAAAWPYALALLGFPAVYYVTNTDLRYRHPIDPELIVLAAYACATFVSKQHEDTEETGG